MRIFPQEILSNIIRFCVDEQYSVVVFEGDSSVHRTTQKPCTIHGLPDVSDLRLVNRFFDKEVKANLLTSFGRNLQLQADGRKCFSAKSARLFDPKRGHLSGMPPLVHELRVNLIGLGPAVLNLVDNTGQLKQVTLFDRTSYRYSREEIDSASDVLAGLHDDIAHRQLRRNLNPMDASKMLVRSLEQLRKKPFRLLLELTFFEVKVKGTNDLEHVSHDLTWTYDLGSPVSHDIIHRAATPSKPLML